MSEQNIYKEHYELQQEAQRLTASLQNIYGILHPTVAPHGVQLTLQEVIELVVQKIGQFQPEATAAAEAAAAQEVVEEAAQAE